MRSSIQSFKNDLLVAIPSALFAAYFFVGFRRRENFLEVFLNQQFLLSFGQSAFMALLIIYMVKFITMYLDRSVILLVNKRKRIFSQLFYGLICPLFFVFICGVVYFKFSGIDISDTVYFEQDALPIIVYILVVNWYYKYSSLLRGIQDAETKSITTGTDERLKQLEDFDNSIIYDYAKLKDIAFIALSDKVPYAKDVRGEAVMWHHSISKSIAELPAEDFFMVARWCIVRRDAIAELQSHVGKHKLKIKLKPEFNITIEVPYKSIMKFKKWWFKL